MKRLSSQQGFTVPELVVTVILSGLFISLVTYFGISYWRYALLQESDLDTFVTRLNAGDYLREAVGGSSGMLNQNSIVDTNAHVPDTSGAGSQYWQPIHAVPSTISVGSTGSFTALMYFRRPAQSTNGSFIMNGTQPYHDEYVLYLDGTTKELRVRTLANSAATGNSRVTTCPPSSATISCPADKVVAKDLASVATRFFSRSGNTVDYTASTDPITGEYNGPDYSVVEVVEFTLNITRKPLFQKTNATQNSTIVRIALRNS
jgi:hypothetical protein